MAKREDITFVTYDLSCSLIAKHEGLKVDLLLEKSFSKYTGYSSVYCNTE